MRKKMEIQNLNGFFNKKLYFFLKIFLFKFKNLKN